MKKYPVYPEWLHWCVILIIALLVSGFFCGIVPGLYNNWTGLFFPLGMTVWALVGWYLNKYYPDEQEENSDEQS